MLLTIVFALFMLPGLAGVILPLFPGVTYMLLVSLIYGVVTDFSRLTTNEFGILAALTALTMVVDYFSGILGAKLGGASMRSLALGMAGLMIGMLILPPFGGIIGLFLGILWNEIRSYGNRDKAIKAAAGGVLGAVVGIGINLTIGLGFLVYFIIHASN